MLPVDNVLPALQAALKDHPCALLSSPPGSGKTTRVPLALLHEDWLQGRKILLLEPRRLAARAVARFMAASLGERVGETVGFRVRLQTKVSARTRIEVVTEGILTRRLQQDPELADIGLIIFDEFHERSLQADLGLALSLDVQQGLREDLRLLLMSATLDVEAARAMLNDAPLIQAEGRSYPVEVIYEAPPPRTPTAQAAVQGVRRALRETQGDVLVFLPGSREIRQAGEMLDGLSPDILVCPLYGDLDSEAQDRAIQPDPQGRRRVVLSTSIAETSLTIEGVSCVVDAGWSRFARFDPNNGLSRLVTERVSLSAAQQRAGRAGRLGPGACYRMWPAEQALNPHEAAEIKLADLAPLMLELALWGVSDPTQMQWLDAPPQAALAQARDLLLQLQAVDASGAITPLGRRMAALPLHPRLAHMLISAAEHAQARQAADVAALLSERDIFRPSRQAPPSRDLALRLRTLAAWRDRQTIRAQGVDKNACRQVDRISKQLVSLVSGSQGDKMPLSIGGLLAMAYPDRVAQRRAEAGAFLLANGRGARLDEGDDLATRPFLAIAAMDAGSREGRIFLAADLPERELLELFAERIETRAEVRWDARRRAVSAESQQRYLALVLKSRRLDKPPPEQLSRALLQGIRSLGLDSLPWSDEARDLQTRVMCLRQWDSDGGWPDLSDSALLEDLENWLLPWLDGVTSLGRLKGLDMQAILRQILEWPQQQALNELAPLRIPVPSGGQRKLTYSLDGPPVLAVKLQEMFGRRETPMVCRGRVPVLVHLLSPAGRPLQITQDLAGFWDKTYAEVRKEMKGRYPKHYWPENPRQAVATARVRPKSN